MRRSASGLPLKVTDFTHPFSGDWLRTTMESVAGLYGAPRRIVARSMSGEPISYQPSAGLSG